MRLWIPSACGILAMSLLLPGCGDPGQIVPVTPPGAVIPKNIPEDQTAEALGESATYAPQPGASASAGVELYPPAPPTEPGETKTLDGGVTYETLKAGSGDEFRSGRVGVINYEGKLDDGTVFDSTKNKGAAQFTFGGGGLIRGWEMAVPGMKVGEVRKIVIPPAMGYGDKDMGDIPPNSTLTFEVELVGIK